jgi:hypothetical protein
MNWLEFFGIKIGMSFYSKEIPLNIPNLSKQKLSVRVAGLFHGPQLLKAGERLPIKRKPQKHYDVKDDSGKNTTIKFIYYFFDPVPELIVDGARVTFAPP